MWTFTSLLHTVSFVCVFVLSGKQADVVPDEVFDAAAGQSVVTVNFSKNQLTSVPPRYCTHTLSHTQGAGVFVTVSLEFHQFSNRYR